MISKMIGMVHIQIVENCESLKVIEIGQYSFADFGGEFELRNLDNLESIKIGEIGNRSMNFNWSSFIIRGITLM